ncbi:MAG: hypothetical protein JJT88_10800 [Gammaproteobacteria bacterium]|nr:hypothetical protein [Gammaproteobacteria bacterium]
MGHSSKASGATATATVMALLLGMFAATPMAEGAQPQQGQVRITLTIPERSPVLAPAIQFAGQGEPRLCNTRQGTALREFRYLDGNERLEPCSPGAELTQALGRHMLLVTPI